MNKDEALRLALEALEYMDVTAERYVDKQIPEKAITAIKAALEAKDKPYAFEASMYSNDRMKVDPVTGNVSIGTPQRTWVEIADEDFSKALELCDFDKIAAFEFFEAKLKEKNT